MLREEQTLGASDRRPTHDVDICQKPLGLFLCQQHLRDIASKTNPQQHPHSSCSLWLRYKTPEKTNQVGEPGPFRRTSSSRKKNPELLRMDLGFRILFSSGSYHLEVWMVGATETKKLDWFCREHDDCMHDFKNMIFAKQRETGMMGFFFFFFKRKRKHTE